MGSRGLSFRCEDPFFVYCKRHFCPGCGQRLTRRTVSETVQSDSPAARNYDFELADTTVRGEVKFMHVEFFCSACQRQYTVRELKAKKHSSKR